MYTVKIIWDSLSRGIGLVKTLVYLATYNVNISNLTTIVSYFCNCLTSKVHLLMIVCCLMFSAWRESTMLKLAQVKIVFSVVIDDDQRPASYTWPKIHLRGRHMSRHSRPIRIGMQSLVRYGADVTLLSTVAT